MCLREKPLMSPNAEQALAASYPATFRLLARLKVYSVEEFRELNLRDVPSIEWAGIDTRGDGWFEILRQLAQRIERWCAESGACIITAKEKFGILRVYLSHEAPIEVREAIAEAVDASENICEVCGREGGRRQHEIWKRSRPDTCTAPAKRFIAHSEIVERTLQGLPRESNHAARLREALYGLPQKQR